MRPHLFMAPLTHIRLWKIRSKSICTRNGCEFEYFFNYSLQQGCQKNMVPTVNFIEVAIYTEANQEGQES